MINHSIKPMLTALIAGFCVIPAFADDGPPGTDIYMASLTKDKSGLYHADKFVQITTRQGYDNQPYFLPDGSGLLYTAMLPTADKQWQSDSFKYDFKTQKHINLTNTPLSEYSPILMNNGEFFSTIVVRDQQQQFWAQPYEHSKPAYRLNQAEPVGYHVWGNDDELTMFILGSPNTLQYQKSLKAPAKVVAEDIGRSLRYIPLRQAFSFSQLKADKKWWLSEYQPNKDKITPLVPMLKGADYYSWLDANIVISAVGTTIYQWVYEVGNKPSEKDWMPWLDVSQYCATEVTRLAVEPQQQRMAFVCDETGTN